MGLGSVTRGATSLGSAALPVASTFRATGKRAVVQTWPVAQCLDQFADLVRLLEERPREIRERLRATLLRLNLRGDHLRALVLQLREPADHAAVLGKLE